MQAASTGGSATHNQNNVSGASQEDQIFIDDVAETRPQLLYARNQ